MVASTRVFVCDLSLQAHVRYSREGGIRLRSCSVFADPLYERSPAYPERNVEAGWVLERCSIHAEHDLELLGGLSLPNWFFSVGPKVVALWSSFCLGPYFRCQSRPGQSDPATLVSAIDASKGSAQTSPPKPRHPASLVASNSCYSSHGFLLFSRVCSIHRFFYFPYIPRCTL